MKTKYRILNACLLMAGVMTTSSALVASASEKGMRPVPTASVEKVTGEVTRFFPGQVRASKRVELAFNVSGQLELLDASEGLEVKKGDLLARLDQRDFQYNLDAAKADFQNAKATFERKQSLYKDNVISKADFDQVEAAFIAAKARLDKTQKQFEDSSLYAPFDAIVSKRMIENYEQVVAKRAVLSLQDITEVEVVIKVPEHLMARSKREDLRGLNVKFDADHDIWYEAELVEFASKANRITKTYDAVVRLQSPEDLNTFTGMTASVRVVYVNDEMSRGLLVPLKAIFGGAEGATFVWVIPENGGKPVKTQVEVGAPIEGNILVTKGLNESALVAVSGIHTLTEAMMVRPSVKNSEGLYQ